MLYFHYNLPDAETQTSTPVQGAIVQQQDEWFVVMDVFQPEEGSETPPQFDPTQVSQSVVMSGSGQIDPEALPDFLASLLKSPDIPDRKPSLPVPMDSTSVVDVTATRVSVASPGAKTEHSPPPPPRGKDRNLIGPSVLWTGVTVGMAANLATIAGSAYMLGSLPPDRSEILAEATQKYQEGNIDEAIALAKSIAPPETISQWKEDWQTATAQFQKVERAFTQKDWQGAIQEAEAIPEIEFWQQQLNPMVQDAQSYLDGEEWLQKADDRAEVGDFTGALYALQQIPEGTALYTQIQPKISEYQEKEKVQLETEANWWVQEAYKLEAIGDFEEALAVLRRVPKGTQIYAQIQPKIVQYQEQLRIQQETTAYRLVKDAYELAAIRDFSGALQALQQIPEGTQMYAKIQPKIAEYQKMQQIKQKTEVHYWIQAAYDRAARQDFSGALQALQQIPEGSDAYNRIQPKLAEYRQKQNIRAHWLLQQAYERAIAGNFESALEFLKAIPAETSSYEIAQAKIREYSEKLYLQTGKLSLANG